MFFFSLHHFLSLRQSSLCDLKLRAYAHTQVGKLFRLWFAGLSKKELEAKILEVFRKFDKDGSGCVQSL